MRRTFVVSSMTGGGAARGTANLANHWAACGETVEILTLHQPHADDVYALHPSILRRDLGDAEPSSQSLSAVLALLTRIGAPATVAGHAAIIARLRDALRDSAPEVVIGVVDVTNIRLLAATRVLPMRVIVSEVADPAAYSMGAWERPRRLLYPQADAVVCLTPEHADFFRQRGVERVQAIPYAALPAPPRNNREREPLIVSLTRFAWEKGVDLLVRAFADVAPMHPEWRVEIYGDGVLRGQIERLIASLNLKERIRLAGMTRDVYEPLGRAKLFALTSQTEGIPNALCEAMAAGVAPVVTECGSGVRTVIREGIDGVIVRPRRKETFAAALHELMRDDAARARLAARAPEVVTRFPMERIAAQWDEVIESKKVAHAC
ncbi:MAG TPA: glycosyltransferase [Thermoanaerobaculia bacterium]|nr:glycosyltransferase [Thermoanaerobaculia bacterium]